MLTIPRRIRLELGRNQYVVAAECGMSAMRLCRIEHGRVEARPDELGAT